MDPSQGFAHTKAICNFRSGFFSLPNNRKRQRRAHPQLNDSHHMQSWHHNGRPRYKEMTETSPRQFSYCIPSVIISQLVLASGVFVRMTSLHGMQEQVVLGEEPHVIGQRRRKTSAVRSTNLHWSVSSADFTRPEEI
jgi:hypothetical protein